MIAALRQRWQDWRRERRIRVLVADTCHQLATGHPNLARAVWGRLRAEIDARSPQQIARMERRIR